MRIASYSLSEPFSLPFSEQSAFFINANTTELVSLFRVLGGSCVLTNLSNDDSIALTKNYYFSDFRENFAQNLSFLNDFEEGLNLRDYEQHVLLKKFVNRQFYKNLLAEICAALFNEEKEKHTAAFLHLYRAYEHLSYAFPMIYAAKTDNYIATFEKLRKWMVNADKQGNVGELGFHKIFVSTLFKDRPEISTTLDIHLRCKDEYKEKLFDGLARKVLGWKSDRQHTSATVRPDKLSIGFVDFHSFIVNLRNRYFHYSSARSDNLALEEIADSDLLFSFVNKAGLYYVATIFNRVVSHQMEVRPSAVAQ